jgi:hypothetical protein
VKEPTPSTIDLVLWLAWRRHTRQGSRGIDQSDLDLFHLNEVHHAVETELVGRSRVGEEERVFVTKPGVRQVVKWLHEGVDPFGRSLAPYWSGRLRRIYGISGEADLAEEMARAIR